MSAERGWLGEPQPERDHKPSHALNWYKMMGAAELPPHDQRVAEHHQSSCWVPRWPGAADRPGLRRPGGPACEAHMSAERGWIGDPQPQKDWHDSHYSREADRIAARQGAEQAAAEAKATGVRPSLPQQIATGRVRDMEELTGLNRRYAHLHTPKHLTNPDHLGKDTTTISSGSAPLRIAPRYAAGRPRRRLR